MAIEISLLGTIEATSGGNAVDLGSPQQRALLALLAVRGGAVVGVDAIIDALWPEDPPPSAAKVVQTYVSRLRKALDQNTIERRGHGYVLDPARVAVDSLRFESLFREGRAAEALELWRGPALADVAEARVLAQEAGRLEELRLRALERRIDEQLAAGDADTVVGELNALVATHPLRERLVGRLMHALYNAGRQAEALEVYGRARTALVAELGIEPGPELKDLQRRILVQDPGLAPPRHSEAETEPPPGQMHPRRHNRRPRLIAACLGVVAAAALATAFALTRGTAHAVVIRPNSIVRIDPKTNKVVESIAVGREPSGIVASNGAVWVANEQDRTLSRIDTRTHGVVAIGGLSGVGFVTSDTRGNIYASGWDYPYVWRIDPKRVRVAERFRVRSRAVGVAVGGGSLWVVDRLVNGVTRIDLGRPNSLGFVRVGADPLVTAFGFGALWVANSDDGTVSVIRPGLPRAQTIRVSAKPFGIAAGEGAVWVGSNADSTVTRIDPERRRVVKVINVSSSPLGSDLYNVAAGAGAVWAANASELDVVRIDPRTNKVVARIKLGQEPRVIAIDGDNVWVSLAAPGT